MKRKILIFLCVAALAITALVSCQKECEHPVKDEWTSLNGYHWHATECEHGEFRQGYAACTDKDEDEKCDICGGKTEHTCTFEKEEWSFDENEHWRAATCTHTNMKGDKALHSDLDSNAKCDECGAHVHILDGAGFCHSCNKEIKPVVESDICSVISATTARTHNVVSATIDRFAASYHPSNSALNLIFEHVAEFKRGTNGTYVKWSYDEVAYPENDPQATAKPTGKTEVLEKWIKVVNDNKIEGISAISVNGNYKSVEPSDFSSDDLIGYYFAVSSLADGHGAEAVLLSLYEAYLEYGVEEADITWDDANNKYVFNFNALVANKTLSGDVDLGEYAAYYYEVKVSFTYADDYTLKTFDVECDCYTSDDTLRYDDGTLALPDFDYDYQTGEFTMRDVTNPAKYTYSVIQTIGTREEIEFKDASEFTPTDFKLCLNDDANTETESITITVGDFSNSVYIVTAPGTFVKLLPNLTTKVLNKYGRISTGGLSASIYENTIVLLPTIAGEYTVQLISGDLVKSIKVIVEKETVRGQYTLDLTANDNNAWVGPYTFTAAVSGTYTFYCPSYGVGIWEKSAYTDYKGDTGIGPLVDYQSPYDNETSFSVYLAEDEKFVFYYMLAEKNATFTVGYDIT